MMSIPGNMNTALKHIYSSIGSSDYSLQVAHELLGQGYLEFLGPEAQTAEFFRNLQSDGSSRTASSTTEAYLSADLDEDELSPFQDIEQRFLDCFKENPLESNMVRELFILMNDAYQVKDYSKAFKLFLNISKLTRKYTQDFFGKGLLPVAYRPILLSIMNVKTFLNKTGHINSYGGDGDLVIFRKGTPSESLNKDQSEIFLGCRLSSFLGNLGEDDELLSNECLGDDKIDLYTRALKERLEAVRLTIKGSIKKSEVSEIWNQYLRLSTVEDWKNGLCGGDPERKEQENAVRATLAATHEVVFVSGDGGSGDGADVRIGELAKLSFLELNDGYLHGYLHFVSRQRNSA